jgi:hypothetical protein
MATTTAGALIVAGLRRAEMVDSPTGYIQHPAAGGGEAFDILNAGLSELFDILYEADSDSYGKTSSPFSTVANQQNYVLQTLAANSFYHLSGVEWFNGSRWFDLPRVMWLERNGYPTPGQPRGYGIEGANLVLYPTPSAIYSMRLWWVGLPPTVSADADVLDIHGPWSEFLTKRFAKECLGKEESDTSVLDTDLYGPSRDGKSQMCLVNRIRNAARKRDAAHPTAPVDVYDSSLNPFWEPWLR